MQSNYIFNKFDCKGAFRGTFVMLNPKICIFSIIKKKNAKVTKECRSLPKNLEKLRT
jgi:hypothetical protein